MVGIRPGVLSKCVVVGAIQARLQRRFGTALMQPRVHFWDVARRAFQTSAQETFGPAFPIEPYREIRRPLRVRRRAGVAGGSSQGEPWEPDSVSRQPHQATGCHGGPPDRARWPRRFSPSRAPIPDQGALERFQKKTCAQTATTMRETQKARASGRGASPCNNENRCRTR